MPRQSVPLSQLLVVCAGFAGGCGEPGPGPDPGSGEPSLAVVGGEQTDTVTAFLPRSLDVRVAGPGGRAAAAVSVSINTIPDPAGRLGVLYLGPGGEALNDGGGLTDGQGRLSARLRFGGAAGRAGVVVEVQALALADTVYFDVQPGRPAAITGLNRDTALQLGRAAVFPTTGVTDRYENPRNDPVSYQSLTPSLSLAGSTVTATAIDRGRLLVHAVVLTDTVRISVVPAAFLAVGGSGLWFFESDFAGFHRSPVGRGFVEWLPGGLEVLADGVNVSGSWTGDLIAATPAGASRPVLAAAIPGSCRRHPRRTAGGSLMSP